MEGVYGRLAAHLAESRHVYHSVIFDLIPLSIFVEVTLEEAFASGALDGDITSGRSLQQWGFIARRMSLEAAKAQAAAREKEKEKALQHAAQAKMAVETADKETEQWSVASFNSLAASRAAVFVALRDKLEGLNARAQEVLSEGKQRNEFKMPAWFDYQTGKYPPQSWRMAVQFSSCLLVADLAQVVDSNESVPVPDKLPQILEQTIDMLPGAHDHVQLMVPG